MFQVLSSKEIEGAVRCRQDFYMPFQFYFLTPLLVLFVTRDISTVINNGAVFGRTVADVCSWLMKTFSANAFAVGGIAGV